MFEEKIKLDVKKIDNIVEKEIYGQKFKFNKYLDQNYCEFVINQCLEAFIKNNNEQANYSFELEKPCMDLVVSDIDYSLDRPNRLRKSYIWNKKIRLAIYKIIHYLPKLISGNYKRKAQD